MGLNHEIIFDKIQELVASDLPVSSCMNEVISICSQDVPHMDWTRFSALDYDQDVESLSSWIPEVFERQPALFQIQGLWIGLRHPTRDGKVWTDMYVGSVERYEPDDEELAWLWNCEEYERHYPWNAYAHSSSLRSIHEIAYGVDTGLGNNAVWPLCLAFAAFATRILLQEQSTELVASTAPRIGVAVGFDSRDMMKIGELTELGFTTI